ncbi:MAG TPA: oligosaccharide flippase family protein [Longimicrobium sp.]
MADSTGPAGAPRYAVLRHGAVVLAGTLLLGAAKAAALWLLARRLGPAVQGGFSLAIAGMAFGAAIFALGLDYANSYVAGRNPAHAPAVARNSLGVFAAAVLVSPLWVLGFVALFPQAAGEGPGLATRVGLLAACTALMSLQLMLQAYALGTHRYARLMAANLATAAVWLAGALLATAVGYGAVLAAWGASLLVAVAVLLGPDAGAVARVGWDRGVLREQLAYGARTIPGTLARALNLRAGLYLIALYLSPTDVGVYGVLLAVAELFLYLPNALGQVVLARAASRSHSAADQQLAYGIVAGVAAIAALVALFAGRWLLGTVFGPAYAAGAPALAALLLAAGVHAIGLLRLHDLMGRGDPFAGTVGQLAVLGVSLGGGWLLIPRYGLMGAAATALLVYLGFTLVLLLRRPRHLAAPAPVRSPAALLHPEPTEL